MPFGAVFTSSAGGDIGGGRLRTRFRGPILAGYASTADPGGQTLGALSSAVAGSAAQPLYSFYVRPDTGLYALNVTASASDVRWSQAGIDVMSWTSAAVQMVSTVAINAGVPNFVWANGLVTTSSGVTGGFVYISQSSAAVAASSANVGPVPTAVGSGAALLFDAGRNKLMVFSSANGFWLGTAVLTSS